MNSVSHVDQPTYSLATALAFQALLCAQNAKDPTGIRTNPYIIVAGRSSSGKDKGREVIKKVFTQLANTPKTKLERHYKPLHHFIESVASYQALVKWLKRNHGVLLWLWDELGKELASWTKDRSANLSGVKTELMRLYSSADSIYLPHVKASSDLKDEETDSIQQPNLILYVSFLIIAARVLCDQPCSTDSFMYQRRIEKSLTFSISRVWWDQGSKKANSRRTCVWISATVPNFANAQSL